MFIQTIVDFLRDKDYFKPNPKRHFKFKKKTKS